MSDLQAKLLESAERFATPISSDAPSGTDVAYDVDFEAIKSEIDKLTSVSGGQPAWRDVVEKSAVILEQRSRDLRLLSWSTVGRLQTKGVDGLAEGLAIMHRVVSSQWETLFPPMKRAKARANLIDWMNEQVLAALQPIESTVANGDAIRAIQGLYDELDSLYSDKLGDAYGGLGSLRSLLRDKVRAIPAAAAPPPPAPVAAAPAPAAAAPAPAPVAAAPAPVAAPAAAPAAPAMAAPTMPTISGVESVGPALRVLGEGLSTAARHLRLADPANPAAYRLHRLGMWLNVTDLPPAEGGRTRLRPPGADVKRQLDAKVSGQQWLDLLNSAEDLTNQYIYWLDLHRHVALAMERLGALFIEARKVVGRELVSFLQRASALPSLAFSDGTPFADPGTQMWLNEVQAEFGAGAGSGGGNSKVSEEDEELQKRFEEARELVAGGKVVEGVGLAAQLAPRAPDERRRFRGRLTVAELALQGGKPEIARPILEGLVREIDERKIGDWEPELCASTVATLSAAYRFFGERDRQGRFANASQSSLSSRSRGSA
ncbi:MAG: type VI secretion system protein TssA [Polyangiaceae bacterium]